MQDARAILETVRTTASPCHVVAPSPRPESAPPRPDNGLPCQDRGRLPELAKLAMKLEAGTAPAAAPAEPTPAAAHGQPAGMTGTDRTFAYNRPEHPDACVNKGLCLNSLFAFQYVFSINCVHSGN